MPKIVPSSVVLIDYWGERQRLLIEREVEQLLLDVARSLGCSDISNQTVRWRAFDIRFSRKEEAKRFASFASTLLTEVIGWGHHTVVVTGGLRR